MANGYAPNGQMTAHLRDPGPVSMFLFTAFFVYVGWFFFRQAVAVVLPTEAALGQTRLGLAVNLAFFAVLLAFTMRAVEKFHGIVWFRLLGDLHRVVPDFLRVMGATGAIYAILIFMGWDAAGPTMRPFLGWLLFLPIAIIGILIQTGAEEFFFRGFLHQFCSVYLRKPLLWLLVPSVLFGLSHMFNDTSLVATATAYVVWAAAFGVACADLTARTGSLGAAWGFHMTVNVVAMCIATQDGGPMSAAALFIFPERTDEYVPDGGLIAIATVFELFFLFVLWLAARNALRR
ncbi:MAG: type II CAAX endopeptidase family protein [Pseudomonadota bacterium]